MYGCAPAGPPPPVSYYVLLYFPVEQEQDIPLLLRYPLPRRQGGRKTRPPPVEQDNFPLYK